MTTRPSSDPEEMFEYYIARPDRVTGGILPHAELGESGTVMMFDMVDQKSGDYFSRSSGNGNTTPYFTITGKSRRLNGEWVKVTSQNHRSTFIYVERRDMGPPGSGWQREVFAPSAEDRQVIATFFRTYQELWHARNEEYESRFPGIGADQPMPETSVVFEG